MRKNPEITEKTKQKFVDAFLLLIKTKPISKITASEITRLAGYNRSTFYEYFMDTDDLLEYIETSLLEEVKQAINNVLPESGSPVDLFQSVFATMNEKIYLLMGPNGDSGFMAKVKFELYPLVETYFPVSKNMPNFDYIICFVHSALFGLLQYWNETEKKLSTKEISDMMQNLVFNGVSSYVAPSIAVNPTDNH